MCMVFSCQVEFTDLLRCNFDIANNMLKAKTYALLYPLRLSAERSVNIIDKIVQ